MKTRHFLSLMDLTADEIRGVIARAIELKKLGKSAPKTLRDHTMAMVFEKSSTRTRTSFDIGMTQLGGYAMFLSPGDSQIQRGEPIRDTARVLSRMVDVIVMRTTTHQRVSRMAEYASVPVINALCDRYHPCQLLADLQTFTEHRGEISGQTFAWIGDGNNVCHSWMNAARLLDFKLNIATPEGFEPDAGLIEACKDYISLSNDPKTAATGARCIITDTWASMGQEDEKLEREAAFSGYCVNDALMAHASGDAIFMHCLPAYRGYEVSEAVLEGKQSVVWDEAENRLHAQKALLELLIIK
ncbi:MAG: ornithine carbamoyltransferase [Proteobacteria bacterium]|nr:ornithine carbamoyltransferase [Pseudomonadota bacterium]